MTQREKETFEMALIEAAEKDWKEERGSMAEFDEDEPEEEQEEDEANPTALEASMW